jgi:branched-chain amino acid transport system substrate-binding protein
MMKRRSVLFGGSAALAGGALAGIPGFVFAQQTVVRFGQSATLNGSQGEIGRDIRDGILAAFESINKAEPRGPRYELVTLDDAGSKDRCVQNVRSLLSQGVMSIVGLTNAAGAEASLPFIEQQQSALLGAASGTMGLRSDGLTSVFHVRAGYDLEFERMGEYVKQFAMKRVGVVYMQDTTPANLAALNAALAKSDVTPTVTVAVGEQADAYEPAALKLLAGQLDCVLFMATSVPTAAIIDRMNADKYPGLFYASSMAGQNLIDTLMLRKQAAVVSVVVPRPTSVALSVVNRCKQDLAAMPGDAKLGVTTLEGYIIGRTAVEASRVAQKAGALSRIRMRESLANLHTDLGGFKLAFEPGRPQGSRFVEVVALSRYGRMVA